MPQNPDNVTNPDLVDVADQGFGALAVDQCVQAIPEGSVPPTLDAGRSSAGPSITNTNPDLVDVADQGYNGLPRDVFV
jgi:hypothetical protein